MPDCRPLSGLQIIINRQQAIIEWLSFALSQRDKDLEKLLKAATMFVPPTQNIVDSNRSQAKGYIARKTLRMSLRRRT
jgi:hypothetical protein